MKGSIAEYVDGCPIALDRKGIKWMINIVRTDRRGV